MAEYFWLVYCLLTLQCGVLGAGLLAASHSWDAVDERLANPFMRVALALGLGYALDSFLLFLLGLLGCLYAEAVLIILSIVTVPALWPLRRLRWPSPQHYMLTLAALLLFVAFLLFSVRVPGYWDDTMYHLPEARLFVEAQRLAVDPFLRFPLFPQAADLMLSLGLMLGGASGVLLAQALATLPLFIVALGLIACLRWALSAWWPGFVAVLLLLILRPIRDTLGFAYIDNTLLLFCWGAMLALLLAIEGHTAKNTNWRWLTVAGFFAGMAIGSKYFGLVWLAVTGVAYLVCTRNWRSACWVALVALLTGGGWYLRAWWISGDPFHPAGGKIFGYYLWNAADLLAQQREQAHFGVTKRLWYAYSALEQAGCRALVPAIIAVFFWRRMSLALRVWFLSLSAYFIFWIYITQVDRYLAPLAATAVFFVCWGVAQLLEGTRRRLSRSVRPGAAKRWQMVSGLICLLLAFSPLYKAINQYRQQTGHWQQIQDSRPGYVLFNQADSLRSQYGLRLINVGYENAVYFFNGTVIGDVFGPGRYARMVTCRPNAGCQLLPARQMRQLMQHFGARMLVVNSDTFAFNIDDYKKEFRLAGKYANGYLWLLPASANQ